TRQPCCSRPESRWCAWSTVSVEGCAGSGTPSTQYLRLVTGGSKPRCVVSSARAASLAMCSPLGVMTSRLGPSASISKPPMPKGPASVSAEFLASWVQRRLALNPCSPVATATRGGASGVAHGAAVGPVRQAGSVVSTASAAPASSLFCIGYEPADGRLQLPRLRIARQRLRPHLARIALLAAGPQRLAPVRGDLCVVIDGVGARQHAGRLRRIA